MAAHVCGSHYNAKALPNTLAKEWRLESNVVQHSILHAVKAENAFQAIRNTSSNLAISAHEKYCDPLQEAITLQTFRTRALRAKKYKHMLSVPPFRLLLEEEALTRN